MHAYRARTSSPCVIFFDEIDGLVSMRDSNGDAGVGVGERMLSQLLQEMDGLQVRPWGFLLMCGMLWWLGAASRLVKHASISPRNFFCVSSLRRHEPV